MVSKCGSEISNHIPAFVDLCLEYITYDPKYDYDEGDDRDIESDNGKSIFQVIKLDDVIAVDDSSGLDGYSDENISWMIRMAAVKCIEAVFINRHEMIKLFYRTISPSLITRFFGVIFQCLNNQPFFQVQEKSRECDGQHFSHLPGSIESNQAFSPCEQ